MNYPLAPYSGDRFRRILRKAQQLIGLETDFTPHSFRAGYATDRRANGDSVDDIKNDGRWASDSSFRIYIDVVSATEIAVLLRNKGQAQAAFWAEANWHRYLSGPSLELSAIPRGPSAPPAKSASKSPME